MNRSVVLLLILLTTAVYSCQRKNNKTEIPFWVKTISCDFEKNNQNSNLTEFKTDSNNISINVDGQLNTVDFKSGSSSIEINKNTKQTALSLTSLEKGQLIEFTIWQFNQSENSGILATVNFQNGKKQEYQSSSQTIVKSKKGWNQHFISIPINESISELDFKFITANTTVSFDDLKIRIYPKQPENDITKTLNIYIPSKSKNKLNNSIDEAVKHRVIPTSSKKLVRAYYINELDTFKIKMKLKGDWSDHVKPNKASYRLKLSGVAFEGMTNFAIQHPKTRNYLNEWIMHKMAEKEDLLCTKYKFVNVIINDYFYGVYALEEHFEKHIIENRDRRNGPILKFDETGVWKAREEKNDNNFTQITPSFEASKINAYSLSKIFKNNTLKSQYLEGINLMQLFKNAHLKIDEIFDIDKLANFYSLIEFSGNYHALTWHNRRFYFNPITQKLEHIYFDAFPTIYEDGSVMVDVLNNTSKDPSLILDIPLLMNKKFKNRFLYYLEQKTNPEYLDSIFESINNDLPNYYTAIKGETKAYNFNKSEFYKRAEFLKNNMENLSQIWEEKLEEKRGVNYWMRKEIYKLLNENILFKDISINAYTYLNKEDKYSILFENYHLNNITLESVTFRKKGTKHKLKKTIVLPPYLNKPYTDSITVDSLPYMVYFTAKNTGDKIHKIKVNPWQNPTGKTTRISLNDNFKSNNTAYTIENDNLIIFSGNVIIDELIYIPSKYKVQILPGTEITFKSNGGIIVNNAFSCQGTALKPITIKSTILNSHGITVLNGSSAVIEHTLIDGLSNLNYKNWILTGALTIYETPVQIANLTIKNNHSEDALNIVRSEFKINNLKIENTKSDGFDADFCTGVIKNSTFINTGNDCIDFSGSIVEIENIQILNSGDKGISGGEKSTLNIASIFIDGAIIGIASKDASNITGNKIEIKNTEVGIASFQKKTTYGIAKIILDDVLFENSAKQSMIEKGSSISINATVYKGEEIINIDSLYQNFVK